MAMKPTCRLYMKYLLPLQESGNLDARLGPMRHLHQQPAQRGGRGNASRLQPVSRDASFGSGSAIPEANLGASGAATAGGSSSGRRTSPEGAHHPSMAQGLRSGSFRFQVDYNAVLLSCSTLSNFHLAS